MSEEQKKIKDPITGARTTGHVWDDDLQEFNNPLPRWWLWAFYATILFTIAYWILFPSWPTGLVDKGFFTGTKTVSFKSDDGTEQTAHWTTRARLAEQMQTNPLELKRKEMVKKIAALEFNDIASDVQNKAFVLAYGKGIFGDNCAGCHQTGGNGVIGHYPNIVDDAWLWGGDIADIQTTIIKGRKGNMPAHKATLSDAEITQVSHYALSLSQTESDAALSAKGKVIYDTKGCAGCHTPAGTGLKALGSANLTDKIWTQANVLQNNTIAANVDEIKHVVANGIKRQMPAFETRLSKDEIKVIASYVKLISAE